MKAHKNLISVLPPSYVSILSYVTEGACQVRLSRRGNFLTAWNAVFKSSPGGRAAFRKVTNETAVSVFVNSSHILEIMSGFLNVRYMNDQLVRPDALRYFVRTGQLDVSIVAIVLGLRLGSSRVGLG